MTRNGTKVEKKMKSTSDTEWNKNRNYRFGTITVLCSFEQGSKTPGIKP